MSSVVEEYNYDIFISYRQKDNKGDRWVSEFVDALKTELESTFKEEISVYFDINPHDGLLETHDVDASLKDKLKCLVFIPIISRTYCDPKSFAWQHEFVSFVEQAKNDRFGLKIKLPHGNVATRVLPVKIHDLDPSDQILCENVLGGVPRGVDFIFKSPGVNRPLRMNEDNPKENLNHTYYRDQINKVANAIDEIITTLKRPLPENETLKSEPSPGNAGTLNIRKTFLGSNYFKILIAASCFAILSIAGFIFIRKIDHKSNTLSIAFIPFQAPPNDYILINTGNSFIEALVNKLSKISKLEIIPRISTLQLKDSDMSVRKIRRNLKADYLIGGRIWNEDTKTKIYAELSESGDRKLLWSGVFVWNNENSAEITNNVISTITGRLKLILSPEEIKSVFAELTANAEANMNYLSGNARTIDGRFYVSYNYEMDSSGFRDAIHSYDKAIELEPQFAKAYIGRSIAASWGVYLGQLDTSYSSRSLSDIKKAEALDLNLPELGLAKGFYYYFCEERFDSALVYFGKASRKNPGDYQPMFYMAMVYRRAGDWKSAIKLIDKVIQFNPREALFLTNIGMTYDYLHKYDSAIKFHQKAIDLMPRWRSAYVNKIGSLIGKTGKTKDAWKELDYALINTSDSLIQMRVRLYTLDKEYEKAINLAKRAAKNQYPSRYKNLDLAELYGFINNDRIASLYFDSALVVLEKEVLSNPGNSSSHLMLGLALAGKGDNARAIEEGLKGVSMANTDALQACNMKVQLARIYVMLGDYGHAMDEIESILSGPGYLSVNELRLDPVWNPLKGIPEYRDLIKRIRK